ncbi:MAG: hypothetical protein E3J72_14940 [Planctomycetota bacterium]|nr:MAG: hypothetical protein E3J72_14940 [Planctomycetota bacterium]
MEFKTHRITLPVIIIAALCIHGCDIGIGTRKTTPTPPAGTTGPAKSPPKPSKPVDVSKLKWYFKNVKVGDWVKYWTPERIEVWEVKAISGQEATIEKRFYDNSGKPSKKTWTTRPNLLGWDDMTRENMEANEKKGKIVKTETAINGMKMKLDVACSRDRNAQVGSIDAYSFSVPVGGRVFSFKNEKVTLWLLDCGAAKDSSRMKVNAGDHKKAGAAYQEPADALEVSWSNLVEQVNVDLGDFTGASRSKPAAKPIKAAPYIKVPITPAAKKVADSQKNGTKGIRPGMWLKCLVQQDHLQIWEVTEVTQKDYKFRRLFHNDKGILYDINCASITFEAAQMEEDLKDDGSFYKKDDVFIMPDTGKKHKCSKFTRKGAGAQNINWYIKELKINTGRVFSKMSDTVQFFVVDFGDETNAGRKKINPGDVIKAKDALYKAHPAARSNIHIVTIGRWTAERKIYLDALNGVLKRVGKKLKKCTKDHYLVDIDAPDTGPPPAGRGRNAKELKRNP